jgi:hypothetical protein
MSHFSPFPQYLPTILEINPTSCYKALSTTRFLHGRIYLLKHSVTAFLKGNFA